MEHAPAAGHTSSAIDSRKLAMWFFLASEVIFFSALISAYTTYRPLVEKPHIPVDIVAANTFLLLASSFTMVRALAAVQEDDQRMFRIFLAATMLLGAIFVGVQAYEYTKLFEEGVTPGEGLFGTTFFGLTGFHGAHVVVGVIWLLVVFIKGLSGRYGRRDHLHVELAGLYWHFVDLVWVFLFTLIYLFP